MSKFYGAVGYSVTEEKLDDPSHPGVYVDHVYTKNYVGEVLRMSRRWQGNQDSINDNLTINNQISILADPYAYHHFHEIKFIEWMDTKWKVTSVEVKYPRLILDIGGVYTEEED